MTEGDHLDLDTLADYAESMLGEERSAAARAHLVQCSRCRARLDDLADVSRLLAETPTPTTPSDVAASIDSALAEAQQARSVTPLATAKRRRTAWLGVAASVIVLVVVGGILVGLVNSGIVTDGIDVASSTGSAGSGSSDSSAGPDRRAMRGSAHTARNGRPASSPTPDVTESVTASGRDYSARELPEQASYLLRAESTGSEETDGSGPGVGLQLGHATPAPLRSLADPGTLATCVSRVTGREEGNRLAVDLASYSGKPSAVIVSSDTRRGDGDIWVVNPSCTHVRVHTELPRNGR